MKGSAKTSRPLFLCVCACLCHEIGRAKYILAWYVGTTRATLLLSHPCATISCSTLRLVCLLSFADERTEQRRGNSFREEITKILCVTRHIIAARFRKSASLARNRRGPAYVCCGGFVVVTASTTFTQSSYTRQQYLQKSNPPYRTTYLARCERSTTAPAAPGQTQFSHRTFNTGTYRNAGD